MNRQERATQNRLEAVLQSAGLSNMSHSLQQSSPHSYLIVPSLGQERIPDSPAMNLDIDQPISDSMIDQCKQKNSQHLDS
jgi:hypothetical protein